MKTPEKTMPNRRENRFQTNLMVMMHTLLEDKAAAIARLKAHGYRDAARDIGLLIWLNNRLQEEMLSTMPLKRLEYYEKMAREAQIVIDFPGAVKKDRWLLVSVRDLAAVTEAAMRGECAMCIREGREIRRCALHEAMLSYAPPDAAIEASPLRCEFRGPAGQLIRGEEIKL